jgi:hypothetical protein
MIRKAATAIGSLAQATLPQGHEQWGRGMRAEIEHISSGPSALNFAAGCLWTALGERSRHPASLASAGRISIASITVLFALFHLGCGLRGAAIMLGAPDPYHEALLGGSAGDQLAALAYRQATPAIVLCLLALGLAHFMTSLFLLRSQVRPLLLALAVALFSATIMSALILSVGIGASGLPCQFAALLLQATFVPALLRLPSPKPTGYPVQGA